MPDAAPPPDPVSEEASRREEASSSNPARPPGSGRGRDSWIGALLSLVYPSDCPVCGTLLPDAAWHGICLDCLQQVQTLEEKVCRRCGRPLSPDPGSLASASPGPGSRPDAPDRTTPPLCGACLTEAPPYALARSLGPYAGTLAELIKLFKFAGRTDLAARFIRMAREAHLLPGFLPDCDLLIPVPLHWRRRRQRGYDQAFLLARAMARQCGIPVARRALKRTRRTVPQTRLSEAERRNNVRGVFQVRRPRTLAGRVVCLVDDVRTTEATIRDACRAVRAAGAREIRVFTVAVTVPGAPA